MITYIIYRIIVVVQSVMQMQSEMHTWDEGYEYHHRTKFDNAQ